MAFVIRPSFSNEMDSDILRSQAPSVADPGSRIQKQQQKREVKKN
jgi:hypothetical protein